MPVADPLLQARYHSLWSHMVAVPSVNERPAQMFLASSHSAATKCWGRNDYGTLGDASTAHSASPVALDIGSSVRRMAPGFYTSAAIDINGAVKGWGQNNNGKLGFGLTGGAGIGDEASEMGASTPTINLGSGRFSLQLTAGSSAFCSLTDMALVKCWGANTNGELGLGDTATRGDDDLELGDYLPFSSLW